MLSTAVDNISSDAKSLICKPGWTRSKVFADASEYKQLLVCFWPKLHSHWRHMQVLHLKLLSAMAGTQTQIHQLWKQLSRRLIVLLIELFWNGKAMFLTALFSGYKLLLWIYCSFQVRKMKPLQKCQKPTPGGGRRGCASSLLLVQSLIFESS